MVTTIQSEWGDIDIDAREAQGMNGSVTIFNPAIKATDEAGNPAIILGISEAGLLVVDTDGKLSWKATSDLQVDWRFDFKAEKWVDASGESLEEMGS